MVFPIPLPHTVIVKGMKVFMRQFVDPLLIHPDGLREFRQKLFDIFMSERLRRLQCFGSAALNYFLMIRSLDLLSHFLSPLSEFGRAPRLSTFTGLKSVPWRDVTF